MQTKTINELVRDLLLDKELPLHYYVPFLNRAVTCLNYLSFDFNMGPNVKEVLLPVKSYDRVDIPAGAINVISVHGLLGDKVLPFSINSKITRVYNLDGSEKVPYPEGQTNLIDIDYKKSSVPKTETYAEERVQVFDISDKTDKYSYNIDLENGEIILDQRHGLSNVYVRYLSSVVSKTSANLIHPFLEPVIVAYIDHKTAQVDGSPQSKVALLKQQLGVEKRNLKARMNPLSETELLEIFYLN